MTTLKDSLGLQESPSLTDVLGSLGAAFVAVMTLWFGWSEHVAPPFATSVEFFRVLCLSLAVIFGGAMIFWRRSRRFRKRHLYIAIAAATLIGSVGWFAYENARTSRIITFEVGQSLRVRVLATKLSEAGFTRVTRLGLCPGEAIDRTARRVSLACAETLARHDHERPSTLLFDAEALRASENIVSWLYRITGLGFMLAMFLVLDEVWRSLLKQDQRTRRRQRPPGQETPQKS
ncbi:MAG TPA: hypothetical protein VEA80_00685 [Vitreimonas sp.]|uniref:hypothetical protein n=1 Tax=Vitreimonas sp. TaxID=3069702 RepID=UPI002D39D365|nr:hypothetical protein [Vitreimonas sp.]HYD85966.1 hypothetical protein [Vitreimonas sp.]